MDTQAKITATKDTIAIVREVTIIVVVLLVVIWPGIYAHWAKSLNEEAKKLGGISKSSFAGQEIAFDHANDTVVGLRAANEANKQIQEQLQQLIAATTSPKDANKLQEIQSASNALTVQLQSSLSSAKSVVLAQDRIIQDAPGLATGEGKYGIVVSADKKDELASYEVHLLKTENFNDIAIYDRAGFLRTVASFPDAAAANAALPEIQTKRPGAYVINLSKWCPNHIAERTLADVPVLQCQ